MLTMFRDQLKYITEKPWIMSWKEHEKVITLETYDNLHQDIGYLIDLYQMATFDNTYRRDLLPSNMRRFDMTITISEFRNL